MKTHKHFSSSDFIKVASFCICIPRHPTSESSKQFESPSIIPFEKRNSRPRILANPEKNLSYPHSLRPAPDQASWQQPKTQKTTWRNPGALGKRHGQAAPCCVSDGFFFEYVPCVCVVALARMTRALSPSGSSMPEQQSVHRRGRLLWQLALCGMTQSKPFQHRTSCPLDAA